MNDERPRLMIFGGEKVPEEMLADAANLGELSESSFEFLCDTVFKTDEPTKIISDRSDIEEELLDDIDAGEEVLSGILHLLSVIITTTSRRDLVDSQIQEDLNSLDIPEDRASVLTELISDNMPYVRQFLRKRSQIDPVPDIVDINWTIDNIVATPAIQGVNHKRVFFNLRLNEGQDIQEITFQADEAGLQQLLSQLGRLHDELSIGIEDLE